MQYPIRRQDIDCASGLAILLVVFGHIVARADPLGVDWYEPVRRAVYAFHMPFFVSERLAGLVIYCLTLTDFLYPDRIGKYAVFFALGTWAAVSNGPFSPIATGGFCWDYCSARDC